MVNNTQGKTTTETFVEEHKDDNAGHLDPDFFKMSIKNFKDAEKNDTDEDGKSPLVIKDGKMKITKTMTRTGPDVSIHNILQYIIMTYSSIHRARQPQRHLLKK